jgi:hypothetical protein
LNDFFDCAEIPVHDIIKITIAICMEIFIAVYLQ